MGRTRGSVTTDGYKQGDMTATFERNQPTGRSVGRVPPHSREAEESVLGALLLSPHAANEVMDKLAPGDFYVPAHQAIFEAMRALYDSNQPLDAVTVSEELRRGAELEKVGGLSYLAHLVDVVPAASNIGYYSEIVAEHGLRRSLIRAGSSITDLAFRVDDEVAMVLDRAEQEVLSVAEKRVGDGMLPVGPLFQAAIEHIEALEAHGSDITGLSTGFRDLDRKLAGLQKANLVVIAARPSMGKSALTLNMATNIARTGKVVALFSLEMAKEEVVQRILCSVGKVESTKLRTGQIGNQWDRLVGAANQMFRTPIFVDDSSVVTVTDIRAKCRRLKRIHGLDLVVVDYLQLMQGSSRENRQQEIAEISRGLKNLARELDLPIIAVSQLNRSVEQREDRRPRLSDLRECLTADTEILRSDTGEAVAIGDIARQGLVDVPVWSLDRSMRTVPSVMAEAWSTGVKPVFRVITSSGRQVRATANHPLLTADGWKRVGKLAVDEPIAVVPPLEGSGPGGGGVLWDPVLAIEADGEEEVFDASVPNGHNFVASQVFAHNSGALEQDSDVVMFIYRHEYYHPDDVEKKGTAEVIIAKHRAGATGTVEMTFMPDFTRFADLGRDLG